MGDRNDSDTSFDSSDSANDSDEEESDKPKSRPLVEDFISSGPTQLEAVAEATKNITGPIPKHTEEEDEVKIQLLKSNKEGDLSHDVAKVNATNVLKYESY